MFPAVEIKFHYIMKEKRRRCYVLLDDDPKHALKVVNMCMQPNDRVANKEQNSGLDLCHDQKPV